MREGAMYEHVPMDRSLLRGDDDEHPKSHIDTVSIDTVVTAPKVEPGEWYPWLAQKLELGPLPLPQGLAVVAVALLPSVAVFSVGAAGRNGLIPDEYSDANVIGHRLLKSSDDSKCTQNTIIAYVVCAIVFALALFAFGYTLTANKALMAMVKVNAEEERKKFVGGLSDQAKATGQGAVDDVQGSAQGAVDGAQESAKSGMWGMGKAALTGDLTEPLVGNTADNVETSVEDGIGDVENSVEDAIGTFSDPVALAQKALDKQLRSSKLFSIFNLVRWVIAEVAVLVGLLGPLVLDCGVNNAWAYLQGVLGILGCALALGIPLWCVLQMARDKYGMYKYFPASQSNKLYELSTGVKVRAVLPDRGEVSGKPRMNWITKFQLMVCGFSLGMGLFIKWIYAIVLLVFYSNHGDPTSSQSQAIETAWITWAVALVSKLPECIMYFMLWCFFVGDFFFFVLGLFPCLCVCARHYDEDDKKELFSCGGGLSCLSTRGDPPAKRGNCCAVWIEKKYFAFYQWFYVFIDKPLSGFTYCKLFCCCYCPSGLKWEAVKKENDEAEAFEAKLREGVAAPERASERGRFIGADNPVQEEAQDGAIN
jgi:hypothetical protein